MTTQAFGNDVARPLSASIFRYLILAFGFSWAIWIGTWLLCGQPDTLKSTPMMIAIYAGSFGPALAGATIAARNGELRQWLARFVQWRIGWRAVAAIALTLPLTILAMTIVLGYSPAAKPGVPPALFYMTLFPDSVLNGAVTAFLGAGPLGEEGGWRGTLLPMLLQRLGEVPASLLLGLIWSAWHLPIMAMLPDWRDGLSFGFYLPAYTVTVMGLSLIMTRVWALSGRSTLAAIWMHGVINALGSIAFNAKGWASPWGDQASMLHFTASIWLAALILIALRRRVQG